ncbi:uncharacterized protein LOC131015793 [Salvia miltiorrhiza]|uniref:uncharacterized protein LOC131015793 n=1 Tax=Salvia miltiorrhiza TaxID=226208 RepID=UPI0025AB7DFD|nr:uncharacterized protein LOC131015793 [Salvia miltiorrhiza]
MDRNPVIQALNRSEVHTHSHQSGNHEQESGDTSRRNSRAFGVKQCVKTTLTFERLVAGIKRSGSHWEGGWSIEVGGGNRGDGRRKKECGQDFPDDEATDNSLKGRIHNVVNEAEKINCFLEWERNHIRFRDKWRFLPAEFAMFKSRLHFINHLKKMGSEIDSIMVEATAATKKTNDPANYGIIEREDDGGSVDREEDREKEEDKETKESEEKIGLFEFDNLKQKDNKYMERINEIDKKLEEKLAVLDYTFGRKGKLLEEEIRDLAEERNALIEQKRQPLYRKGFDVRLVDVNRTCKVTKGGQVIKYTAMLACGNYNGVIGFAKAKAPAVPIALQKAYEKCFQNLHYVERHEDHTIAHAIQTSYKKTKIYLWPAPTQSGMKAGRTVELILNLAGYRNVKSKVVGSRNPHNTVKALFKALNAIETPKDVQEKFGRTVVESYLL